MEHQYQLRGSPISLRPLEEKDLEIIRTWRNQEEVRKWFINDKEITMEGQQKWFKDSLDKGDEINFVIEESLGLDIPIGMISLYHIDMKKREAELGRIFICVQEALGKGYGAIATKMLCHFAFETYKLYAIRLQVFKDNDRAISSYLKVGFVVNKETIVKDRPMLQMSLSYKDLKV